MPKYVIIRKDMSGDVEVFESLDQTEALKKFGEMLIKEAKRIENTIGMLYEDAIVLANERYIIDIKKD